MKVSIILLILLFGCITQPPQNTQKQSPTKANTTQMKNQTKYVGEANKCLNQSNRFHQKNCLIKLAAKSGNQSICYSLENGVLLSWRDDCLRSVAATSGNHSICRQIHSENIKDICLGEVAVVNRDSGLCDLIETRQSRDWCYNNVAPQLRDASLCSKITHQNRREDCLMKLALKRGEYE
ncbi:MAG: hypothetical protein GF334_08055, partial [Candidatus Altiarchaeales archaeon]|nr:hypothetical protein [Candidatus Altiarchaeales archaeon]